MAKRKFKAIEKDAKDSPVKDIQWEGEEVQVDSTTKIQEDKGTGQKIILRFFDFVANPEIFKIHKPTAQELFSSHIKGMQSLLWRDGLRPYEAIEPRLLFSKDKKHYRFVITCVAGISDLIAETPKTLSQLLVNSN